MGLDVIGRVLEVVSGLPLDRLFRQRIFRKMGMKDTVPWLPQLSRLSVVVSIVSMLFWKREGKNEKMWKEVADSESEC